MTIIHDNYIIAIDKKYESNRTKSGIITLNSSYMEEWSETHLQYRRIFGTVLACPLAFSDTVLDVVVPGMPEPRIFISGEYIGKMIEAGYKRIPSYAPSTCDELPKITLQDIAEKMDIQIKDRVYFDYLVTDQENFLGTYGDQQMYLCRVDRIYCVVRKGKIIPQGGWCLLKPNMETWEDIKTPMGIFKKTAPGAKWVQETDDQGNPIGWKMITEGKYLEGFIAHINPRSDVRVGDHVLYQLNADALIKVEGEEYYVMKESDVLCKV